MNKHRFPVSISFQEELYDESKYAISIGKYLGTEHNTFVCNKDESIDFITNIHKYLDEPLSDPSYIPTLLLSNRYLINSNLSFDLQTGIK